LIILIIVISVLPTLIYFRVRNYTGNYVKIDRVENVNRISLEYFAIYIIPFLTIDLVKISDMVSLVILFAVMCFMYVKSDLLYMNPMLNLIGFNIYKVASDENEYTIISRKNKEDVKTEEVIPLGDTVFLGTGHGKPRGSSTVSE